MSSPRERATTTSSPSGTRLDRDCNHALEREIYKRLLYTAPSFSSSFDSFSLGLSVVCLNFLLLHANGEGRSSGEKKRDRWWSSIYKKRTTTTTTTRTVSGAWEAIQSPVHSGVDEKMKKRKAKMSFVPIEVLYVHTATPHPYSNTHELHFGYAHRDSRAVVVPFSSQPKPFIYYQAECAFTERSVPVRVF
jgi:hypothetical protein